MTDYEDPRFDLDDYEYQQNLASGVLGITITDTPLDRAEMYQAWFMPELYPDERQPVLKNWPAEDLWAYCGIQGKDGNAVH